MLRCGLLLVIFVLAGCSGYLSEDFEEFKLRVAQEHPVGSSVSSLEKQFLSRGYKETGAFWKPTPHRPDPLPICYRKNLTYGFWAGGQRAVCVRAGETPTITEIETYQLVAGL